MLNVAVELRDIGGRLRLAWLDMVQGVENCEWNDASLATHRCSNFAASQSIHLVEASKQNRFDRRTALTVLALPPM